MAPGFSPPAPPARTNFLPDNVPAGLPCPAKADGRSGILHMVVAADNVSYLAALGGGVVSFLSPCVLPIVPAYLSVITGLDVAEVKEGDRQHLPRIALHTGLFIAGFTAVFVLLGLTATTLGRSLLRNQSTITRLSGVLIVAMALYMLGSLVLRAPGPVPGAALASRPVPLRPVRRPDGRGGLRVRLDAVHRPGPERRARQGRHLRARRPRGPSCCSSTRPASGSRFMPPGLAFGRLAGALDWVKRHSTAITASSALALGFFGVLLAMDRFTWLTAKLQEGLQAIGLGRCDARMTDGCVGDRPPGRAPPAAAGRCGRLRDRGRRWPVSPSCRPGPDDGPGGPAVDVTDPARFDLPTLDGDRPGAGWPTSRASRWWSNFFASWCEPCKKELARVRRRRPAAGRARSPSWPSTPRRSRRRPGSPWPAARAWPRPGITLARDVGGQGGSGLHDAYEVRNAMPVTAFYDAAGKLKYVAPGQLTRDKLSARLQELFGVSL